jgi:hypothetical protein
MLPPFNSLTKGVSDKKHVRLLTLHRIKFSLLLTLVKYHHENVNDSDSHRLCY